MTEEFFVTCPKGLEELLAQEITALGAHECRQTVAGVYFSGELATAYRVCMWSRIGNRVLLPLMKCEATSEAGFYRALSSLIWEKQVASNGTICVDFIGTNDLIRNTQFGAQVVKDAIVDRVREVTGERPNVDRKTPDLRVNVRLTKNIAYISIDLSGDSLHRRGYRRGQGGAPLKENLAAAILLRANWPDVAAAGGSLIDPMCGSGTFLIEAAYMAADIAPGIMRDHFGFVGWAKHDTQAWGEILQEAQDRKVAGLETLALDIMGYDQDPRVLDAAEKNIYAAGLGHHIQLNRKNMHDFKKPTHKPIADGLLICNPPYGERLGEVNALRNDYLTLAKVAKEALPGWQMAIFTGNPELGKAMRLRPKKKYKLFNGPIASELLLFDLLAADKATLRADKNDICAVENREDDGIRTKVELTEGAKMVANRLRKNKKRLAKWVKHNNIICYRLYDADMPEYAAAIDIYGDQLHVQEYQAPKSVDEEKAKHRFDELLMAICEVFDCDETDLYIKTRRKNKGKSQYQKLQERDVSDEREYLSVREGNVDLLVNLSDYLDTGLFLDHRPLRLRIASEAAGKRFLNLFCYTATATVHAAVAGATSSMSVDLSNTYLDWAEDNFENNHINGSRHELVRADVLQWINDCRQGFDLIMLDPPTFSNSKKMEGVLDVQKDHVAMIHRCMELLNPGGTLYFSNNLRSFKMDQTALEKYHIQDITNESLDMDFANNRKIHHCWKITDGSSAPAFSSINDDADSNNPWRR